MDGVRFLSEEIINLDLGETFHLLQKIVCVSCTNSASALNKPQGVRVQNKSAIQN